MRGYPKGPLSKTDYENLLSMPEHAEKAKADLAKLAETDDSKISIDTGTEKAPRIEQISNPLPAWKRAGFKDVKELESMSVAAVGEKPVEEKVDDGEVLTRD
jgi:hypothetical protein